MYTMLYSNIILPEVIEFKENHEERIAKPGFKFTSSEAMSQNTLTFWAL